MDPNGQDAALPNIALRHWGGPPTRIISSIHNDDLMERAHRLVCFTWAILFTEEQLNQNFISLLFLRQLLIWEKTDETRFHRMRYRLVIEFDDVVITLPFKGTKRFTWRWWRSFDNRIGWIKSYAHPAELVSLLRWSMQEAGRKHEGLRYCQRALTV